MPTRKGQLKEREQSKELTAEKKGLTSAIRSARETIPECLGRIRKIAEDVDVPHSVRLNANIALLDFAKTNIRDTDEWMDEQDAIEAEKIANGEGSDNEPKQLKIFLQMENKPFADDVDPKDFEDKD